jgi:hypothetical protein
LIWGRALDDRAAWLRQPGLTTKEY